MGYNWDDLRNMICRVFLNGLSENRSELAYVCNGCCTVYVVWYGWLLRFYTGCLRRNVPDFGRVFLMLKYAGITQNTYVQS
jgi:hypothetical protein